LNHFQANIGVFCANAHINHIYLKNFKLVFSFFHASLASPISRHILQMAQKDAITGAIKNT